MELTDRELKLLMIAADNTGHMLFNDAGYTGDEETLSQAQDLDALWQRLNEELTHRSILSLDDDCTDEA